MLENMSLQMKCLAEQCLPEKKKCRGMYHEISMSEAEIEPASDCA